MKEFSDIERFIGRYSIGRDSSPLNPTGSHHFLRVKVPGGLMTSEQLSGVSELSEKYGRGWAEITNRQDIQLHWIEADDALEIFSAMEELGFTTDMCGQGFTGARYGDARNIVCCPASGLERNEILNGLPLMKELTDFFVGNPDYLDMPRKFKFSITGCGSDCVRSATNDLALVSVRRDNEEGFTLLVGGSMGSSLPGPRLAKATGVFVKPEGAFDVAVATIDLHKEYGSRESKAKARFKWLIEKWGVERYISKLEERVGGRLETYDGQTFHRHSNHEGIQPQKEPGYHYVNIPLLGGRLSSRNMARIAELAKEYGTGEIRLTPTQNIIIANVRNKDALVNRLTETGFSFGGSSLRWNSIGCSSDFCGKTEKPHAKEMLAEIVEHLERTFDKESLSEARFRIHISGCSHNCCATPIAEIGLGGKLVKDDGARVERYDVFLGGRIGEESKFGDIVAEKLAPSEVRDGIASLMSRYLEKRIRSEGLGEFCRRCGKEELNELFGSQRG